MRYVIFIVTFLLVAGAVYFSRRQPGSVAPEPSLPARKAETKGASEEVTAAARNQKPVKTEEMPGAKRPDEPNTVDGGIEAIIRPEEGYQRVNVSAALAALEKLDPEKLTKEQIEALRWSLFEPKANETIRNNTANILLKAKDERLAGALAAQLKDLKQTPLWRNYCVQHLEAGYRNLKKDPKVLEAIHQAAHDPDESVRDVCLLHLSRTAVSDEWEASSPHWFKRTVELTEKYLEGSERTQIERISGIYASGRLGLVSKAKRLTSLLSNTSSPLGIRKAAATALGQLVVNKDLNEADRKEALSALEAAVKDRNRLLRGMAERSLALALPEKKASDEISAKDSK